MGGRAGGGAGLGTRGGGANQPRMTIQKGTKGYEKAQVWASNIMEAGNFNRSDYIFENDYSFRKGNSVSAAINHKINVENANHEWDDNYKYLSKALGHVSKHGNDFEKAVARLNAFSETVKDKNVIKMFMGKGNILDSRIDYSDVIQIILVDGYNLKLFSSLNIKEIYGDR